MFVWRWLAGVLIGCVVTVGCGGSGNFGTVMGTVTHKGAPVNGAKVEFHGTTQEAGKSDIFATLTDSSGKYFIAGTGDRAGIPPGMYKVVVTKFEGDKGPQEEIDPGQIEAQMSDMAAGSAAMKTIKNLLPSEYASPESTKLSATVQAGKNEGVNFDLP